MFYFPVMQINDDDDDDDDVEYTACHACISLPTSS